MKNTNKTNTNTIETIKGVIESNISTVEKTSLERFNKITDLNSIEKITLEKVKIAIELFNELEKEYKTIENQFKIEKMIELVNEDEKAIIVNKYVSLNHHDLIKALAIVKIDIKEKDTPSTITNKVKNAIAYNFYKLDEKDNSKILVERLKGLTFDDIIQAKAQLIANKKADKTITKEEKTKAEKEVFNDIIKGILYCSSNCACTLEKITDTKLKHTPEFQKVYKALEITFEQQKKENPFSKTSRNALEQQLKIAISTCLNTTELDEKVKKYYGDLFCKMLVTTNSNNGLQKELQTDTQLLQSLVIVCRYIHNDIVPQFKHNKTIHTTK